MNLPVGVSSIQWADFNPSTQDNNPSLQDTLTLPKEKINLHEKLTQIMEKFNIEGDIDKISPSTNVGLISEINQQIQWMKKEINESPKLAFDLKQLEKNYGHVIRIIKSGYLPDRLKNVPVGAKSIAANTNPKDDLLRGIRTEYANDVTVAQILRFRAATNADTRNNDNRDVYDNFNKLINERSLGINSTHENTDVKLPTPNTIQIPTFGIVSKTQLLSIIKQLEDIYGFVNNHMKWKQYMEYIQQTIKKSFQDYCEISTKHKNLLEIKSLVDQWAQSYDKLTTFVKTSKIISQDQQLVILEMLSKKNETDQIFTADLLHNLDIDQITERMNQASSVFKTHYKMINDFIQPIIKPNVCKICLTETCDRFIDSCGHTLCNTCAQRLLNNEAQSFAINIEHSMCPYCNKDFTKDNVKPIYW